MGKVESRALLKELYLLAKQENMLERKLQLYQFVASCFWHNYSNTYSNKDFEDDLIAISNEIIDFDLPVYSDNNNVLHIMTEALEIGGHTRVVNNWIGSNSENVHSILINNYPSNCPDFLASSIAENGGAVIFNSFSSFVDKAKFLVKIASQFKYVVLHHHPHDILPLLGLGTKRYERPTFFYNHADHVWGCGYSVCDRILELRSNGAVFTNKYRGISSNKSLVMGIPLILPEETGFEIKNVKTVVSMAVGYKFSPTSEFNFQAFIETLLQTRQDIVCEVIGVKPDDHHWHDLLIHYPGRIKLYGELPKNIAYEILRNATLYIDSFPLPSFSSFAEALSLGIPAVSLETPIMALDSYAGLVVKNTDELLLKCHEIINYTADERKKFIFAVLPQVKYWHSLSNFDLRLIQLNDIKNHNPIQIETVEVNEEYAGFLYEVMRQNKFKFDSLVFSKICYSDQQKVCRILAKYGLLYESRQTTNDDNILETIDGIANYSQLFIATENRNEFSSNVVYSSKLSLDSVYIFDLTSHVTITRIRFDPIAQPAKVRLLYVVLKLRDGQIFNLNVTRHNGNECNGVFDFKHNDPQFIFNIPADLSDTLVAIEICVDICPYNRSEMIDINQGLLKQLENVHQEIAQSHQEVTRVNQEIVQAHQKLFILENTVSWKITAPLRKTKAIVCKLRHKLKKSLDMSRFRK